MPTEPRLYLDHAATTPVRPEVVARMASVLAEVGNPSSVHAEGRAARRVLEDARDIVAASVGADAGEVVFTSGGTEANDLALGAAGSGPVLVSAVEHASVLDAVPAAERLPVDAHGLIDLAALERLVREVRPALVSVMLVNNETGVVQDIGAVSRLCAEAGILLHVDAVQALGKLSALRIGKLGCDLLTISAHKVGGPPGVGALVLRPGVVVPARLRGGSQEERRRAGTQNLAGIAGFAEAVRHLDPVEPARLEALRQRLEHGLAHTGACSFVAAADAPRAPHVASLVTPGWPAQMQVIALDLAGVAVSAGAACSSGKVAHSHVLAAMGMAALAGCAVRISLGWTTTERDIDRFVTVFAQSAERSWKSFKLDRSPLPNARAIAT